MESQRLEESSTIGPPAPPALCAVYAAFLNKFKVIVSVLHSVVFFPVFLFFIVFY